MRLRLLILPPEIAKSPWELLYDNDFLATSDNILVLRFLPVPTPSVFVTAKRLKVLVIVQEPEQMPILPEVKREMIESLQKLGEKFAPPKVVDNPTSALLRVCSSNTGTTFRRPKYDRELSRQR
jgi:hypothetical protein